VLLDDVDALVSSEGAALLAEATALLDAGASALQVGSRLRHAHDAHLVSLVMAQVELRSLARGRLAGAGQLLLTRDELEQASSTAAAEHKARRFADIRSVADLCCGIGGDLISLADGRAALAVDRDPVHLALALHNASATGATDVRGWCGDVREADLAGIDGVHVDPARRRGGRRTPGDSEPPLSWAYALAARLPLVCVKAAPGLDVASVPDGWEVEFLAEGRDLTQAVLWSPAAATSRTRATVLPGPHELVPTGAVAEVRAPGAWLVDPSPAVTRAGAVGDLAEQIEGWQVDRRIAFLCTDSEPTTPFGRSLRVVASLPWDVRALRAALRDLDVGSVDLRRRGLAGDVDVIRRLLRLNGTTHAVIAMTRVLDRPWAIVCRDPAHSSP
jgi:hypothetical protein